MDCPRHAPAAQSGPVSTTPPAEPYSVEDLLRVIEVRYGEFAVLRLMVEKLKLQLLRRVRAQFGTSSEQLQASLIDEQSLSVATCKLVGTKAEAANAPTIDRSLPAYLPREAQVHRPETSADHHDAAGQPCGCIACGGRPSPNNSASASLKSLASPSSNSSGRAVGSALSHSSPRESSKALS